MANNIDHQKKIEQARQLLSPFLDGEVTAREQALVEAALAADPKLQAELDSLQTTVNLLGTLPAVVPPRPFTLSEADVAVKRAATPKLWLMPDWLKLWGTATVGLLCVLAIGGVLFVRQMGGGMMSAPAADVAMRQEAAAPEAAKSAEIVAETEIATAAPEPQTFGQEEAAAEKSVEAEVAAGESSPADSSPAENTPAAEQPREAATLPAEKSAPAPAPAPLEMAAPPAEEEPGLERQSEAPLAAEAEGALGGGAPPPGVESLAAAPPVSEEVLPAEAPMLVDNAAEAVEVDETEAVESRANAATPTVTVSPAPTSTPVPSPSPSLSPTAVSPASPVETSGRSITAVIFGAGALVILGLGGGLWLVWRKHRR